MSKDIDRATRRKVLLGLGGIGAGAVLGGTGTVAFLSDKESSSGNAMTAGELDLKVGWQKSYNGEQLPTQQQTSNPGPIFEVPKFGDIKPGDRGEATINVSVDDNPAWLWLGGEITSTDDNTLIEPEEDAGDTTGGDDQGELQEKMMARVWYDENCNNVHDGGSDDGQELEVALVSDVSGSMRGQKIQSLRNAATNFVDNFSTPDEGAAISFTTSADVDQPLTTDYEAIKQVISQYQAGGGTNIAAGIDKAHDELTNGPNATEGADKVMVLLSDGKSDEQSARQAATAAKDDGIRIITIAFGSDAADSLLDSVASSESDAYEAVAANLGDIYQTIAETIFMGEEIIASGTLAEVFDVISAGVALDGDRSTDERDPYTDETQCLGFEWWVPKTVGNVIQSDSVTFDLKFYAEQYRHNDSPNNPFGSK